MQQQGRMIQIDGVMNKIDFTGVANGIMTMDNIS